MPKQPKPAKASTEDIPARKKRKVQAENEEEAQDTQATETEQPKDVSVDEKALQKEKKKARKLAQKQAKKEKEKEEKKKAQEEKANREAKNKDLKKKGKLTRKEIFLANKAKKKAEMDAVGGGTQESTHEVSEGTDEKEVDPRAVKCFLTGLPYMASETHITNHFAKVGACTAEVIRDSAGKATGKAFLTFGCAKHALKASAMTGTKIQNRWINVRLCEVREEKDKSINTPVARPEGCLCVVVKCDKSVSEASLWKYFEDCEVSSVSCMNDSAGNFRGMAFLDFEDAAMVDKAVKKNGLSLKGYPVMVRYKLEGGKAKVADEKPETDVKPAAAAPAGQGRIAAHNRAPPVPAPSGKQTILESDSEDED